ncbi:calcium/sodium antiporter [Jannaschia formosa]|uniref:calcium/sodium antiporter n=1 Tax=Jannaschia formosa TaxID=2259592 RepID=UPI000E1B8BCD|nr:calcium/sodium antiporter [Jannaschia formosa]TFL19116.1 calcium/sodium antiporter [Jannaschia formosa]
MDILLVLAGLVALLLGGGWLVSGAVGLAARMGLSPLVIGVTLVGMGTSMPELLTSLRAAQAGAPDLALGNVVGSNIANILLILAVAALMAPIVIERRTFLRDGIVLLAISVAGALWLGFADGLDRIGGAVFLGAMAVWMTWQLRTGAAVEEVEAPPMGRAILLFALGLVGVLLGAEFLVRGAIGLARGFGISEAVIGLTVVAVGTSLPELAASAAAARRGRGDLALGNVLGSNVFNLLGILGATALIAPLDASPRFASFDLPVMVAVTAALLALGASGRIGRLGGGALLAGYAVYLWTMI